MHSFNRYVYANNNPYKYTDPTGGSNVLAFTPTSSPVGTTGMEKLSLAQQSEGIKLIIPIDEAKSAVNNIKEGNLVGAAVSVGMAVIKPAKIFSKEKQALVDMAKSDKKNDGVTQGDMDVYSELNSELPDPFPSNKVRGLEVHPNRPHGQEPHGHVGPVNHIPEKKIDE